MKYSRLYIWGPNKFSNRYIAGQIHELSGTQPLCIDNDRVMKELLLDSGCLLFCDCDKKEAGAYCTQVMRRMGVDGEQPSLVLLNVADASNISEVLLYCFVRGVFYASDGLDKVTEGLGKVLQGKEWFPQSLLVQTLHLARKQSVQPYVPCETPLTRREKEILQLITSGCTNHGIGENLGISSNTVKAHISNLYKKIGVTSRVQAILWASKNCDPQG